MDGVCCLCKYCVIEYNERTRLKCIRNGGKCVKCDDSCEYFELDDNRTWENVEWFLRCRDKLDMLVKDVKRRERYLSCLGKLLKFGCRSEEDVKKFMSMFNIKDWYYKSAWGLFEGKDRIGTERIDEETKNKIMEQLKGFDEFLKSEGLSDKTVEGVIRRVVKLLAIGIEDPYSAKRYGGNYYGYCMRKYLEWKKSMCD